MKAPVPSPISERMRELADRRAELERKRLEQQLALARTQAEEEAAEQMLDTIRWTVEQLYPGEGVPCTPGISARAAVSLPRRRGDEAERLTPLVLNAMRELNAPTTAKQIAARLGVDERRVGPTLPRLKRQKLLRRTPNGLWELDPDAPAPQGAPPQTRR